MENTAQNTCPLALYVVDDTFLCGCDYSRRWLGVLRNFMRATKGYLLLQLTPVWTLRYSLRRVSPLDSVKGGTHNPKLGGSIHPPQPKLLFLQRVPQTLQPSEFVIPSRSPFRLNSMKDFAIDVVKLWRALAF